METGGAATRPLLLAVATLGALLGLLGGAAAAWAIYHRLGAEARTVPVVPGPGGTAGPPLSSLAADRAPAIATIVTHPVTVDDLLAGSDGLSAGFVASPDGLVVTSARAVAGATLLRIALPDGHAYDATVARADLRHGVVVLQAAGARDLPTLRLTPRPPRPGDFAMVLSHPPLGGMSIETGTVRATGRTVAGVGGTIGSTALDASIVSAVGGSEYEGAPLLDGTGSVIGVVTNPSGPDGGGAQGLVALSGSAVRADVERASRGHGATPATFGADSVALDPAAAAAAGLTPGALLRSVDPDGPAAAAGLAEGDIVTSVNGVPLDADHPLDATALGLDAGQRVRLSLVSRGRARTVDLTLGEGTAAATAQPSLP